MQQFPLFSEVILTKNFPQFGFLKGQVTIVVEFVESNGYTLEGFDNEENTKNIIAVLESDIDFLNSAILSD